MPALVVLVGLCAGLAGASWLRERGQADAHAAFQRGLDRAAEEITRQFRLPLYGLRGARGVYVTHDSVNRETFRAYVASRNLPVEFPGMRGMGFIERVPRSGLQTFLERERADDAPAFALRQLGDNTQPEHFIVKFIEPAARNPTGAGLDLASEPVRRQGLMQALASGEPTVSGLISLSQSQGKAAGVLIFLPVFESQTGPSQSGVAKPGLLRGVLFAPIVISDLLAQLSDVRSGQLRLQLFDSADGSNISDNISGNVSGNVSGNIGGSSGNAMYDSAPVTSAAAGAEATPAHQPQHDTIRVLDLPGRKVTLRASSSAAFDAQQQSYTPWLFLAGTLLASLLLAGLLRQQATGRVRAERMARDMTADLSRLALVARRSSNAVVITDLNRRITWVNEGFERITGYSAAEALGQVPSRLLHAEAVDAAVMQQLQRAIDNCQGFKADLLQQRKNGETYWASIDVQPLLDDAGTLVGFMALQLDITERKNAERELRRERLSLQNVIDGTHAGTWEWNVETGQSIYNERWAEMVGWSLAELNASGPEAWRKLVHPDDYEHTCVLQARHFAGLSEAYECELRLRHKSGHWVWVQSRGKLFSRTADGKPRWMAGTHIDISARKQVEAALQASQAFLAQTGRIGGVGGWELDLDTSVFEWTDEACLIHDVEPGHRPSLVAALDFFEPGSQQAMIDAVQQGAAHRAPFDVEMPVVTAKGRRIWVRTMGEPQCVDGVAVRLVGAFQDVTARRALEDRLRNKNELLNAVINSLPCGLSVFDRELKSVLTNSELHRLLDLPASLMQRPGVGFEDIVRFNAERGEYGPGESEALVRQTMERVSGTVLTQRFERVRPNGTALEVRGAPMPSGGFVTTYTDITARRQAEAEAKRNADLLRGAVDALDDAFVLYDADDRLVMCNQRHRDIYPDAAPMMQPGRTFEEVVRHGAQCGQYAEKPVDIEAWVAQRVAQHRQPFSRLTQQLADGRTLRIVERRMADGHTVGFRVDITELVHATRHAEQAEQEASRSLARLQAIYDILPVGLTVTDPQGHIIDCNPASERLLGISKEEHLRRDYDASDWVVLREDGTAMPSEEFPSVRALSQGVAITDSLMQVVTPESAIWLSVSAMPVKHDALGVVIAYADVTEQRQQRQALLAAKAQAEAASVAKSQFLANMSHEIRTPMNAILGMLALLKKTEMSQRQADYAGKTEGAARSLLGLLNDILDFSKVEAGKMLLDPNPFQIDQLMRDLSVIVSANVGAKPVEVLFDIDPALPRRLVGDAMRLQQVLINLSGNAIKFTERGEVVVSVKVLAQSDHGVTLRLAVRDTGIGIAPENQARIFSGFTQAEASTTRRFGGTGLGVAISQRLVTLMGGDLRLESALGQGSTFHFTLLLPVAAADGEELAAESLDGLNRLNGLNHLQPKQPAQPLRALVVDDNPTARDVLQRMAQSLGWTVDAVDSGEAALAQLQSQKALGERYDAVFVDWQMPGLDGWATTRQIREGRLAGDAPVVVMVTAHGREMLEQRSSTEQQLLDGFLVKPVTASMLLDAVVDARRSHDQPHPSARGAQPTGARLAGMRLLVVEDNLNNQQVALELLEDEGADVQIAGNGQIAVEAVAAADPPFDVVLMDLQMPVMDGFTATARIRQDLQKTSLPIVAMTANAMASDREACLAAGMNDHVGKPFDLDHLVRVLRRVAGREAVTATLTAPSTATAAVQQAARGITSDMSASAQTAGVQLDAALRRLGGKLAVYERLLRGFVQDLPAMAADLQASLQPQDTAAAARLLHTLKGLAATLGVQALADLAGAAEKAMAAHPTLAQQQQLTAGICEAIEAARVSLTPLQTALQTALQDALHHAPQGDSQTAVPSSPPADAVAVEKAMRELVHLLETSDMRATEVMATLQQQCAAPMRAALQQLDDAVGALDFERALSLGKDLLVKSLLAESAP